MKTSISQRANLTCRLVRTWISVTGEASAGHRGIGSSHVESCAECRRFFSAGDNLTAALKRDAARTGFGTPAGLDQRIMQAVHRSARPSGRRASPFGTISLAGLAVCAAIAVVLMQKSRSPDPINPDRTEIARIDTSQGDGSIPSKLWDSLTEKTSLQGEVDFVYADAQSAIRFLGLNFLPTAPANGSEKNQRRTTVDG